MKVALDPAHKTPHVDQLDSFVTSPFAYAFHGAMNWSKNEEFQILRSASGLGLSRNDFAALEMREEIIVHPDAQHRLKMHLSVQEQDEERIKGFARTHPNKASIVSKFMRFSPDSDLGVLGVLNQMRAIRCSTIVCGR